MLFLMLLVFILFFFFFTDPATTEIYTLSLHDALPIYPRSRSSAADRVARGPGAQPRPRSISASRPGDRKSTRLNSSHGYISYAVFCLKKKKKKKKKQCIRLYNTNYTSST